MQERAWREEKNFNCQGNRRESPAYGYIATTIRLRSRLLSSTELGTKQLGSQWDHISTTAPVGRNKMASAIRLLFQIPRGRISPSFFFPSLFLLFFPPIREIRPIGRSSFALRILRHLFFAERSERISLKSSSLSIRDENDKRNENPSAVLFPPFLFTIVESMKSRRRYALETLDPHFCCANTFRRCKGVSYTC